MPYFEDTREHGLRAESDLDLFDDDEFTANLRANFTDRAISCVPIECFIREPDGVSGTRYLYSVWDSKAASSKPVSNAIHLELPRLAQDSSTAAGVGQSAHETPPSLTDGSTDDDTPSIETPEDEVARATDYPQNPASSSSSQPSTQPCEDSQQQTIRNAGSAIPENLPGDYRLTTLVIDDDVTSPISRKRRRDETDPASEVRLVKRARTQQLLYHARNRKALSRKVSLAKIKWRGSQKPQKVHPYTAPAPVSIATTTDVHDDLSPAQENNVELGGNARNAVSSRDRLRSLASGMATSHEMFEKCVVLKKMTKDCKQHPCYIRPPGDLKAQIIHICDDHGDLLCPCCVDRLRLSTNCADAYDSLANIVYDNENGLRAHLKTHMKPWRCRSCNTRLSASSKLSPERHKCKPSGRTDSHIEYSEIGTSTTASSQKSFHCQELHDLDKIVSTCKTSDDYRQKVYDAGKLVYEYIEGQDDVSAVDYLRLFLAKRQPMTARSNAKSTRPAAIPKRQSLKIVPYRGPITPTDILDIPITGSFRIMNSTANTNFSPISESQQLHNEQLEGLSQFLPALNDHSPLMYTNHTGLVQDPPEQFPPAASNFTCSLNKPQYLPSPSGTYFQGLAPRLCSFWDVLVYEEPLQHDSVLQQQHPSYGSETNEDCNDNIQNVHNVQLQRSSSVFSQMSFTEFLEL